MQSGIDDFTWGRIYRLTSEISFRKLLNYIFPSIVFVLLAAVTGIIGNRADSGFLWVISRINQPLPVPASVTLLVFLILLVFPIAKVAELEYARVIATKIIELDDVLFRSLSDLHSSPDPQKALKRIVESYLSHVLEIFDEYIGVVVYIPDEQKEYLYPWTYRGIPQEQLANVSFSISGTEEKTPLRGVAGTVFLEGKLRIVHFSQREGRWLSNDSAFRYFENVSIDGKVQSMASIPIIDSSKSSIAVLCIISPYYKLFDSDRIQQVLLAIAQRLSTTMSLARKDQ